MIEKVLVAVTLLTIAVVPARTGCQQSVYELTCHGKNSLHELKSTKQLSEVDTLNVHQGQIDLTDDFIPRDISFSALSLLNVTDNDISRIGRRGFDKIRNVQFLYLSNNKISHSQPDPLQALTRLEVLEMDAALGGSAEEKADVLQTIFSKSKNKFANLAKIELNSNGLATVYPKTFCGVKGLKRLELSNNSLETFDFARKCFGDLKALMLSGNSIKKIPADIWDFLPSLSSLDISKNPLDCDCDTVRLLSDDDVAFINQADTKCASPPDLAGKGIFEIPKGYCSGGRNPRGKTSFFQFAFLFVLAIGILYLYKKYRERLSEKSSTPVGYHNLEHEIAVQPEFV